MLCTLLNSHPDILCHHELFNPRGIFYALDRRDGSIDLGTVADRDRDPLSFLETIWRFPDDASCIGFKMTRGQDAAVMAQLLSDVGIAKIVLRRANRVRTFVSELVAQTTDRWECYDADDLPPTIDTLRVEVEQLHAHARLNAEFYDYVSDHLRTSGQAFLEVMYERLLVSAEQRRLLQFLGVTATDELLAPRSVKQNHRELHELISNFAEVERALRHSEYLEELRDRCT